VRVYGWPRIQKYLDGKKRDQVKWPSPRPEHPANVNSDPIRLRIEKAIYEGIVSIVTHAKSSWA